MAAVWDPLDLAFFSDRNRARRSHGAQAHRSQRRFLQLVDQLGLRRWLQDVPRCAVVGSKGKGTIASVASAELWRRGYRVGTVQSPPFRWHRERIALDGEIIDGDSYARTSTLIREAIDELGDPDGGEYLSPTAAFLAGALQHFRDSRVDALVVEAGKGGRSDEVASLEPTVVGMGPILMEHRGELGDTLEEIAQEKWGIVSPTTEAVVSVVQEPRVVEVSKCTSKTEWVHDGGAIAADRPESVKLACATGLRVATIMSSLASPTGTSGVDAGCRKVFVPLPGRASVHDVGEMRWLLDGAVDRLGAQMLLEWLSAHPGITMSSLEAIVGLSDGKDRAGVLDVLQDFAIPWTLAAVEEPQLTFSYAETTTRVVQAEAIVANRPNAGAHLVIGSVSVLARVIHAFSVDTERLFAESTEPAWRVDNPVVLQ